MNTEFEENEVRKVESFRDWINTPMGWWDMVFVIPFLWLTAPAFRRMPWILPNYLTMVSFVICLTAAAMIVLNLSWSYLVAGILVQISYLFDCLDGLVARMNRMSSSIGAFLDMVLDRWKLLLLSSALVWVAMTHHDDFLTAELVVFNMGLGMINAFTTFAIREITGSTRWSESSFSSDIKRGRYLGRWMAFADKVGIRPTAGGIEADMIVFCIGLILVSFFGWEILRVCVIVSILIHLIPLQTGHFFFALTHLPRASRPASKDTE